VSVLAAARAEIRAGRFQRTMALVTAFSAVVSGVEAYTQHLRGAFDHWLMWTPIWLTPPTVLAAVAALVSPRAARIALPAVSLVSLADGLIGFGYHLRGVARMPGGFRLGRYNLVMGPPLFAPLLTGTVGVCGLVAAFLRRERLDLGSPAARATAALATADLPLEAEGALAGVVARVACGEFQRVLAVVAAAFALLAGGEAYLEHLRGSFNQWVMWTPVWLTPPMAAAALGAVGSERVATRVLPWVSVVTFLDGLLGFGLHLRGIKRMPGHFLNLQFNLTMGPPLFAPLLLSSVGLMGLVASLLRRKGA
jgi:hypothetical protein